MEILPTRKFFQFFELFAIVLPSTINIPLLDVAKVLLADPKGPTGLLKYIDELFQDQGRAEILCAPNLIHLPHIYVLDIGEMIRIEHTLTVERQPYIDQSITFLL